MTEVSLGRVGIVMGLEVSRLARNSIDWHRLLERDAAPKPRQNDRLYQRTLQAGETPNPFCARSAMLAAKIFRMTGELIRPSLSWARF